MRKSTVYLLILALVLSAITAYLAIHTRDVSNESAFTRRTLEEQRVANREVYELDAKARKLEEFNAAAIDERKRLIEENDSLKLSNEAKIKDIQKMTLFSENAKKACDKAIAERDALAFQVNELDKKLEVERKRADGFSEELAEMRNDTEFKNLKKEQEAQKARIVELENLVREKEVNIARQNDEITSREHKIEALRNDPRIKQMEQDLIAAKEEIENLRQTNLNLRRRLSRE